MIPYVDSIFSLFSLLVCYVIVLKLLWRYPAIISEVSYISPLGNIPLPPELTHNVLLHNTVRVRCMWYPAMYMITLHMPPLIYSTISKSYSFTFGLTAISMSTIVMRLFSRPISISNALF